MGAKGIQNTGNAILCLSVCFVFVCFCFYFHQLTTKTVCLCLGFLGFLPDTLNWGLRMHRECRERFPPPPTSKETSSQRSLHASRHVRHARAVMHVGITYPRWRGKPSRHSRRMRTRNFTHLVKGPWWDDAVQVRFVYNDTQLLLIRMVLARVADGDRNIDDIQRSYLQANWNTTKTQPW